MRDVVIAEVKSIDEYREFVDNINEYVTFINGSDVLETGSIEDLMTHSSGLDFPYDFDDVTPEIVALANMLRNNNIPVSRLEYEKR